MNDIFRLQTQILRISHEMCVFFIFAGKDCGFPGRPDNGSTQSAEKFFYPGEEVTFECDGGFILFGKARRTCLDDGTWTDTLPECSEYTGRSNWV